LNQEARRNPPEPRRICARNVPLQKSALSHLANAGWLRYHYPTG